MTDEISLRKNTVRFRGKVYGIEKLAQKLFHIPNSDKLTEFPPGLIWVSVDNTKYVFNSFSKYAMLLNEDTGESESVFLRYSRIFFFDVVRSQCSIFIYDHRVKKDLEEIELCTPYYRNQFEFKGDLNQLIRQYGTGEDFFNKLMFDFVWVDDYIRENLLEMEPTGQTLKEFVDQFAVSTANIFDYAEEMHNESTN